MTTLYKIIFSGSLTFLLGCINMNNKLISTQDYNLEDFHITRKVDLELCPSIKINKININLKHEGNIDLSKYFIEIAGNDSLYYGEFMEDFMTTFNYCENENPHATTTIIVSAIDKNNKRWYQWSIKNSFDLSEVKELEIILKYNGDCVVKFK